MSIYSRRAKLVADTLNTIEGFKCQTVQGAMYAFPQVRSRGRVVPDTDLAGYPANSFAGYSAKYASLSCMNVLKNTN